MLVLTVINKVNDLIVSRDSLVKYKFTFVIDVSLGVTVVVTEIPYQHMVTMSDFIPRLP